MSESGFMMEEETLQLIIGHLRELKSDLNGVKMDISAVNAGQEELSTEMNAVYARQEDLKVEMNAVYAGQEELKNDMKSEISALRNDIENSMSTVKGNISALETKINAGQEELRQEIMPFRRE
jgi:chromosome segregation ATPase